MVSSTPAATSASIIASRSSVASVSASGAARIRVPRPNGSSSARTRKPAPPPRADTLATKGPPAVLIEVGSVGVFAAWPGGVRVWPKT